LLAAPPPKAVALFTKGESSIIIALMRIFTGIKLTEEAREKILQQAQPFKTAGASIRWTASGNIHLTLKFIGEVDERMAERVAAALAAARIAVAPFRLRFSGFGKFPHGEDLKIFWAGVEDNPGLLALFNGIEEALLPLGIARDTRPFQPHLTLGRNKARADFAALLALLAEKQDLFLCECPVAAFQLYASRLLPSGPVYSELKEIALVQS
jgi:RNA 2',3'-cyclic 3'-phosphodiesterase